MTANLRDGYREGVWAAVPEGSSPPDLELRRTFLLGRLRELTAAEGRPLRVLDVGCGEAQLTAAVAAAGHEVVGIDVAEEPLRRARSHEPGLDLRRVDTDREWPLPDAHFDVVWAGETIEHVLDTAAWLSELRRVLRSGGSLLLSTPAHGRLRLIALALSGRRFDAHFDPRSDHLRFYSSRTLLRLLEDLGFERIELRRAGGPPLARHTLLASAVRSRF
jgi:2-polyprenyl-3-methyl-5-hydroxy-6-metoxy-1,4-benzoquinol methylase